MYTLLIVDDFEVDRENLKECINWGSLGISSIIEASNGRDALKVISKTVPDFVLTDVQMPFMNGIELAENLKRMYPAVKVIFVSYYNDFEYLKSAVDLNIFGYILKPVIAEEIYECFSKIVKQKQEEKKSEEQYEKIRTMLNESKPLLVERFLKSLLYGSFKDKESIFSRCAYLDIPLREGFYKLIAIQVEERENGDKPLNIEEMQVFSLNFRELLNRQCKGCDADIVIQLDDYNFVIIQNSSQLCIKYECSDALVVKLSDIANMYTDKYITIGVSNVADNIVRIPELYDQCLYAIKYKFYFGKGQIINYGDITETANKPEIKLNELQKEIIVLLNLPSDEEIDLFIENLFKEVIITPDDNYVKNICFSVIMCLQIALNEVNESFENIFEGGENIIWNKLLRFETIVDMKKWLKNILMYVSSYYVGLRNKKNDKLVLDVIDYLKAYLQSNITVKDISQRFYFSPNYINNIFKSKTGKSIPEYLTMLRVEKARHLLEEDNMKIYEIVEAVGYARTTYFNTIFKRYTGVTPKEYREGYNFKVNS